MRIQAGSLRYELRYAIIGLMNTKKPVSKRDAGDVLALGFGISALTWAVGYVTHIPGVDAPPQAVFVLLVIAIFAGGIFAGKYSARGAAAGFLAGLIASFVNLLILGSVISEGGGMRAAAIFIPGSIVGTALIAFLGAALGSRKYKPEIEPASWNSVFGWVLAGETLMLLTVGGLVTSAYAGLAVVDWPNTFGSNMFLFPLAKMTGGIYFEHAHRLFGTLVGLTTLVYAIRISASETRRRLKGFAWLAFAAVAIQGILGGLRVTGVFTLSTNPEETAPSLILAVVHGVFGQVFFAMTVALAIFTAAWWSKDIPLANVKSPELDRKLAVFLVPMVIVQILLGAILRHFTGGLHLHITFAVVLSAVGIFAGARAWGNYAEHKAIVRTGLSLMHTLGVQLALGLAALIATGGFTAPVEAQQAVAETGEVTVHVWRLIVPTLHQVTGALILALCVMLAVYVHRFTSPAAIKQEINK